MALLECHFDEEEMTQGKTSKANPGTIEQVKVVMLIPFDPVRKLWNVVMPRGKRQQRTSWEIIMRRGFV